MTSAGRVLVVDDTESSRYVLSSWLRRAGYEVVEAATGEEALRSLSPDLELAVLDVNLPDMSGFDVCQAIKSDARTAAVPVLQVSATAVEVADRVTGLEKGADAYLVEPLEPGEFLASVGALIRYYAARRRAESLVARLSRLSLATLAVHAATSLPELLDVAATGAADTFGRCSVVLAASERQQVDGALAVPGSPSRPVSGGPPAALPPSGDTPRWTPAAEAGRLLPPLAEVAEPGWLLVEIRGRSGVLGLLAVAAPDDGMGVGAGGGAEDGVVVAHYARVLAVALDNLRLFVRVELLQRLTAALSRARDVEEVATTVVSAVTAGLGAQAATISVFEEPETFRTLAGTGLDAEFLDRYRVMPVAEVPIAADVLATCRPVLVTSFADRDRRYPFLAGGTVRQQAWANLPLLADGRAIGLAAFGWTEPRDFSADEVELLEAVAGQCAAALDRARRLDTERAARAAAETAQDRLALLARASAVVAAAADEDRLLSDLADLLAPLCSWTSMLLPDERGRLVRRQVRAADPAQAELATELVGQVVWPLHPADPRAVALDTGRPARLDITDLAPLLAFGDRRLAARLGRLPLAELLAVPLLARGQVLGVLGVWRTSDQPPFGAADVELLGDVAARAGTALDNLRVLAARTRVAAALQASLLPERLPSVPGVELAARYLPAEQAAEVGGDFYDAFPLGVDEYALVIGDVSGRGVDAAGLTGLARSTLHALPTDLGPAATLSRLNTLLLARTGPERFLTAAYLRLHLHPDRIKVTVCSAGHPLPLLVRADATVTPVGKPGPLLGLLDTVTLSESSVRLAAGDNLLLYTDGVVEAHGADGLFGEDRLTGLLAGTAGQPAARLVDTVQQAVLAYRTGGPDDLALLALRVLPPTRPGQRPLADTGLPADAPDR